MNNSNEHSSNKIELKDLYPGIPTAYEIALKSYDWSFQRSDTVDNRISRFLTWATTITAGIIAIYFSYNKYSAKYNYFFYIGIGLYALIVIAAAVTEWITRVDILSPEKLYNDHLHQTEYEFKLDIIAYAGDAFKKNLRRTEIKGYILTAIIITFIIELLLLTLWLTS